MNYYLTCGRPPSYLLKQGVRILCLLIILRTSIENWKVFFYSHYSSDLNFHSRSGVCVCSIVFYCLFNSSVNTFHCNHYIFYHILLICLSKLSVLSSRLQEQFLFMCIPYTEYLQYVYKTSREVIIWSRNHLNFTNIISKCIPFLLTLNFPLFTMFPYFIQCL